MDNLILLKRNNVSPIISYAWGAEMVSKAKRNYHNR